MHVSPFALDGRQRAAITVDELALRILRILQHNFGSTAWLPYGRGSLPSIRTIEVLSTAQPHEMDDRDFAQKWAEAVQYLRTKNLIVPDPAQDNDESVVLTAAGRETPSDAVVVGVASSATFMGSVEATAGPLDPVVRQYLGESYRAFEQDLTLSATFMLGAASERALYLLAAAVDRWAADKQKSEKLAKCTRAREVKEWILEQIPDLRRKHSEHKGILTDVQDKIETLFTLYRYQRNEVGHPRDDELTIERDKIKALLMSFGLYLSAVSSIIREAPSV